MLILASDTEICKDEKNVLFIKNAYNTRGFSEKMDIFHETIYTKSNEM